MPTDIDGGVAISDHTITGREGPITVRDYIPAAGAITRTPLLWIHGGGFSNGGLDQKESDAPARAWAAEGRHVRTVNYRLAKRARPGQKSRLASLPNRFPAGLHDVIAAVNDLAQGGWAPIVGGASAGACLAAAATLKLRDEHETTPHALVLAYGTFHAVLPSDPELENELHGRGRLLFRSGMVHAMNLNYAGTAQLLVPGYAFPGGADLSGFPPCLLLDAENDRLRASGRAFEGELVAAGIRVNRTVVPDSVHGFLNTPKSPTFHRGVERIARWMSEVD